MHQDTSIKTQENSFQRKNQTKHSSENGNT